MNNNIVLAKNQTKAIAYEIYGDVKDYCRTNFERYFPWYIDDIRKSKGKAPLKLKSTKTYCNPKGCSNCEWQKLCHDDIEKWG